MGPLKALDRAFAAGDLPSGGHILMACSGGRDSMALAHALSQRADLRVTVATVDHGLRAGSAADARFVAEWAAARGLAVRVLGPIAAAQGEGPEDVARQARFALLEAARAEVGAERIVLAHTADDQLETVLMRLAGGAGLLGLGGMPPTAGLRVRPWLEVRRAEVADYVRHHEVPFREDPSNADSRYLRNRVRAQVLPAFESVFGPGGVGGAVRSTAHLRSEAAALKELSRPHLTGADDDGERPDGRREARVPVDVARLRVLSPEARSAIVHQMIDALYALADRSRPRSMAGRVERVVRAIESGRGAQVGSRDGFSFTQAGVRGHLALKRAPERAGSVPVTNPESNSGI